MQKKKEETAGKKLINWNYIKYAIWVFSVFLLFVGQFFLLNDKFKAGLLVSLASVIIFGASFVPWVFIIGQTGRGE